MRNLNRNHIIEMILLLVMIMFFSACNNIQSIETPSYSSIKTTTQTNNSTTKRKSTTNITTTIKKTTITTTTKTQNSTTGSFSSTSKQTTTKNEKIKIENYVGKNINEIKLEGITLIIKRSINKNIKENIVISQNIDPGVFLEQGEQLSIEVSSGIAKLIYGYNLNSTKIPREYTLGKYYFSINKYDNNVFLRTVEGIVVKNRLILSDVKCMFFDNKDIIYFQKISDGKIYSYSLSKNNEKVLINKKCDYYYYNNGSIFYSANNSVEEFNISKKTNKVLINNKAQYFQIYNDNIYILEKTDGSGKIKEVNIKTQESTEISVDKVKVFIINDFKVFYYSNNKLVYIDLYDYSKYQATIEQANKLNF